MLLACPLECIPTKSSIAKFFIVSSTTTLHCPIWATYLFAQPLQSEERLCSVSVAERERHKSILLPVAW